MIFLLVYVLGLDSVRPCWYILLNRASSPPTETEIPTMARKNTRVLVLTHAERLPNSTNGNPRYRLHFLAGDGGRFSARTSSDAAVNYDIANLTNSRLRDQNAPLRVTFTPAGHVAYISEVYTIRYTTKYESNVNGAGRIKVTWRDRNGTRRQKSVPYDHGATDPHLSAVASVADVSTIRVGTSYDSDNVYTVDF